VTLRSLIGTPVVFSVAALPYMLSLVTCSDSVCEFSHAHMLIGWALACCWPLALSLQLFSWLGAGWFANNGQTFQSWSAMEVSTWSNGLSLEALDAVWSYGTVSASAYDHNVSVYFCYGLVVALCSNKSLRIARAEVRSMAALRLGRTSANLVRAVPTTRSGFVFLATTAAFWHYRRLTSQVSLRGASSGSRSWAMSMEQRGLS
jgi:hypothetical protein